MGNGISSSVGAHRHSGRRHGNNTSHSNRTNHSNSYHSNHNPDDFVESCNDLKEFPPEIALSILSKLDATDLCLASCVWQDLAEDEVLWKRLCYSRWSYTSAYSNTTQLMTSHDSNNSNNNNKKTNNKCSTTTKRKPVYKSLYLLLDEASLIYSFRPHQGVKYLIDNHVVLDEPLELAKLIHGTSVFYGRSTQLFLKDRHDVLDAFVQLQLFAGVSLCDSIRHYFMKVHPPEDRGSFLEVLVEKFSARFHECNPECGLSRENIALLCYSLLLLSVDLYSPHVKNKMSKREFIRNNRQVMDDVSTDVLSDMYDDVYLNGHVVAGDRRGEREKGRAQRFPFYRPYGAIFDFKPIPVKLNCAC